MTTGARSAPWRRRCATPSQPAAMRRTGLNREPRPRQSAGFHGYPRRVDQRREAAPAFL